MSYNTVSGSDMVSYPADTFAYDVISRLDDIIMYISPDDMSPYALETNFVMPSDQICNYVADLVVGSGYDYYIFQYYGSSNWFLYVFDDFIVNAKPFEISTVTIRGGYRYQRYNTSNPSSSRFETIPISTTGLSITLNDFTNISVGYPALRGLSAPVKTFSPVNIGTVSVCVALVFAVVLFLFRRNRL